MIISVTQFNNFVKAMLESEPVLNDLQVRGEICNCRYSGASVYFSLKDENCLVDCFAYTSSLKEDLSDGVSAIVRGRPNYLKSGRFSFTVSEIRTEDRQGKLFESFLQLKEKLRAEGLFLPENKKSLPRFCFKVGVVTSVFGAVIEDITKVAQRRCDYIEPVFFPARVQGNDAIEDLCAGLDYFSASDVDAVIVARGGGSFEELNPFNSEQVVRAVARCSVPVISAVGHETDFTLCDFAADIRASTPSVAAEMVTADNVKLALFELSRKMGAAVTNKLSGVFLFSRETAGRLIAGLSAKELKLKNFYCNVGLRLLGGTEKKELAAESAFTTLSRNLKLASPLGILERGYAVVRKDREKLFSPCQVKKGDDLEIILRDGKIKASVETE